MVMQLYSDRNIATLIPILILLYSKSLVARKYAECNQRIYITCYFTVIKHSVGLYTCCESCIVFTGTLTAFVCERVLERQTHIYTT